MVSLHYFVKMSEVTAVNACKWPVKRFDVGCCTSGSFGDYCPNPNPNIPRRVRALIFCNIIEAVDHLQYKVLLDNGVSCESSFSMVTLFKRRALLLLFCLIVALLVYRMIQSCPHPPPQDQLVTDQEGEEIEDSSSRTRR